MVSDLNGPLGSAIWGLGAWCPTQRPLHLGCAGPWSGSRTRQGRVEGWGWCREALLRPQAQLHLLAPVTALVTCLASTSPLTRRTFISPSRAQHRVSHQEISKELEDREGHSCGEEGQRQRRGSWLGRGVWVRAGCPREQAERPSSAIGLQ